MKSELRRVIFSVHSFCIIQEGEINVVNIPISRQRNKLFYFRTFAEESRRCRLFGSEECDEKGREVQILRSPAAVFPVIAWEVYL